jgi:hypothetical protein
MESGKLVLHLKTLSMTKLTRIVHPAPGGEVSIPTILSINFVGDGLRDVLDPAPKFEGIFVLSQFA